MKPSTVIVDYGMGNLRSVQKAFEACGEKARVSSDPAVVRRAGRIVLPGVGAFGQAMRRLRRLKLDGALREKIQSGTPYLGICLGLQILFESSEENPSQKGLGIFPGRVRRFTAAKRGAKGGLKIPHMGWNEVASRPKCPLFKGAGRHPHYYFVHSYYAEPRDKSLVAGVTNYPKPFCSVLRKDKVFATQFHPEKSQRAGLRVIKNFLRVKL